VPAFSHAALSPDHFHASICCPADLLFCRFAALLFCRFAALLIC
jgi:hypothetical protein